MKPTIKEYTAAKVAEAAKAKSQDQVPGKVSDSPVIERIKILRIAILTTCSSKLWLLRTLLTWVLLKKQSVNSTRLKRRLSVHQMKVAFSSLLLLTRTSALNLSTYHLSARSHE